MLLEKRTTMPGMLCEQLRGANLEARHPIRHRPRHHRRPSLRDVLLMSQTRQAHLCSLLNAGHPFRIAILLTSIQFNVPTHQLEREFYK